MHKRRAAIILAGAIFLLFGSIGVNVFFHTCHDDGQFVSYFTANEDHCEAEERGEEECCDADDHSTSEEHDCCDDEIKQFKVEPDFYQDVLALSHLDAIIPSEHAPYIKRNGYSNFTPKGYANPPPISRSERIVQHQSWLI